MSAPGRGSLPRARRPRRAPVAAALALGLVGLAALLVRPALGALAPRRVAQVEGWVLRTYDGRDLGRENAAAQGYPDTLARGDFDGDGVDDLVVGAPRDPRLAPDGGWLGVLLGGPSFPRAPQETLGDEPDQRRGAVLTVGDYNADGFDDLVLGTPLSDFGEEDGGAIWLWEGSPTGMRLQPRPFGPRTEAGDQLGAALATGDQSGDGIDDLAVAATGARVDGRSGAGRVTVMAGQEGAGPQLSGALVFDREADDVPGEPGNREGLGAALALVDMDGDGHAELAASVPAAVVGGQRDAGEVLLAFGAPPEARALQVRGYASLSRALPEIAGSPQRGDAFGEVLLGLDVEGDGYAELAIGSPASSVTGQREAGDVVLVQGAARLTETLRSLQLHQDVGAIPGELAPRHRFGEALAAADLEGGGRRSLLVGAPGQALEGRPGAGVVALLPGGPAGLDPERASGLGPELWPLRPSLVPGLAFGAALAAGDFNGDGEEDLAIGAPGQRVDGVEDAGAFVVAWGDAAGDGVPGLPTATLTPAPSPTRATATPTPTGPTPTPVTPMITPTPRPATPTPTPRPPRPVWLPYVADLGFLDRYGTATPRP